MKSARIHPTIKKYPIIYVSGVKKKGLHGKMQDWEYSSKAQDAIELSDWWIARFESDMKFCGMKAQYF